MDVHHAIIRKQGRDPHCPWDEEKDIFSAGKDVVKSTINTIIESTSTTMDYKPEPSKLSLVHSSPFLPILFP